MIGSSFVLVVVALSGFGQHFRTHESQQAAASASLLVYALSRLYVAKAARGGYFALLPRRFNDRLYSLGQAAYNQQRAGLI